MKKVWGWHKGHPTLEKVRRVISCRESRQIPAWPLSCGWVSKCVPPLRSAGTRPDRSSVRTEQPGHLSWSPVMSAARRVKGSAEERWERQHNPRVCMCVHAHVVSVWVRSGTYTSDKLPHRADRSLQWFRVWAMQIMWLLPWSCLFCWTVNQINCKPLGKILLTSSIWHFF